MKERIRNILREERSIQNRVMTMIKDLGSEKTFQVVGSFERFKKIMNIETPMDYLHLFDGITPIESEESPELFIYQYKENHNMMVFSRINDVLYIDSDRIVDVLRDEFELNNNDTIDYLYDWLGEEYNLKEDFIMISKHPKRLDAIK